MKVQNISFGQKIPIAKFNIYDKFDECFVNAKLYELDCKDKEDIYDVEKTVHIDIFKKQVVALMNIQYMFNKTKKIMPEDIWTKYCANDEPTSKFYIIENEKKDIIGICHTDFNNESEKIGHLASEEFGAYKYIGQGMIAAIAKNLLKNDIKKLNVYLPTKSAIDFYIKKCGFEKVTDLYFEMNQERMQNLVDTFEYKTGSTIDFIS